MSIVDEGVGIRPEHMDHIFEPFFTTKSDRGGQASVCRYARVSSRNIVGRLEFDSKPGKGTKAASGAAGHDKGEAEMTRGKA